MKLSVAVAGREALASAFVVYRGLEESMRKASDLGYDGVELALKRPDEISRADLRALLHTYGLEVSAISSGQVWAARALCFTEEDPEKRKELRKTFRGFIDLASDFGQIVNIGRTRGSIGSKDPALAHELFFDMAHDLADYAQARGVDLILEPVNRYEIDFINSLDEAAALLDRLDRKNFLAMPDVFHMNIEDDHIGQSLIRNKRYVRYIHFADSNRHAPGDAHMDWEEIFHALSHIGYTGWTSVEILPLPDPDTAARRSIDFLRGTYGSCYN